MSCHSLNCFSLYLNGTETYAFSALCCLCVLLMQTAQLAPVVTNQNRVAAVSGDMFVGISSQ